MTVTEILGLIVSFIGISIAVYQAAVINEGKKRKHELQHLLAGVHALAVHKASAWKNQISLISEPPSPEKLEVLQLHIRARDDMHSISSLCVALEGAIDTNNSAIDVVVSKVGERVRENNKN